jgi:hypothetical protein
VERIFTHKKSNTMPIPRTFEQPLSPGEREEFEKKLQKERKELKEEKARLEKDEQFKKQPFGYQETHRFQTEKTGVIRKDHMGNRAHGSLQD